MGWFRGLGDREACLPRSWRGGERRYRHPARGRWSRGLLSTHVGSSRRKAGLRAPQTAVSALEVLARYAGAAKAFAPPGLSRRESENNY